MSSVLKLCTVEEEEGGEEEQEEEEQEEEEEGKGFPGLTHT